MICSSSESVEALYKAARGAGFPAAQAKQAAMAAVWLQGRGHRFGMGDGFAMMLAAIDTGPSNTGPGDTGDWSITVDPAEMTVLASGASIIDLGPCVIDLLLGDPVCRSARLVDVAGVGLLVGMALLEPNDRCRDLSMSLTGDRSLTVNRHADAGSATVTVGGKVIARSGLINGSVDSPDSSTESTSVDVADHLWARASELALATHVPTTEASRLRGAGAGLTDND